MNVKYSKYFTLYKLCYIIENRGLLKYFNNMTKNEKIQDEVKWLFENFQNQILDSFCEEDKIFHEYYIYFCDEIS